MRLIQSDCHVDRDSCGTASAFSIDYRDKLSAAAVVGTLAPTRSQPRERVQKAAGAGWSIQKFARARPHGIHDHLTLGHVANGEDGGVRKLGMQSLNRAESWSRASRWNINYEDLRVRFFNFWDQGVRGGVEFLHHGAARRSGIHQRLQQVELITLCCHDADRDGAHAALLPADNCPPKC